MHSMSCRLHTLKAFYFQKIKKNGKEGSLLYFKITFPLVRSKQTLILIFFAFSENKLIFNIFYDLGVRFHHNSFLSLGPSTSRASFTISSIPHSWHSSGKVTISGSHHGYHWVVTHCTLRLRFRSSFPLPELFDACFYSTPSSSGD